MRSNMQRLSLLLIFLVVAFAAWADLSDYSFTQSTSTYNEITGGTVLGTNENDQESFNAIPLGFTFTYNDVEYTEISVQNDGFIAFGSTVAQSNLAISSADGTNNVAAAFNRDLKSRDDGSLSYVLTGTAPNRVFTIQWKNYRRVPTSATNDVINFQIQLKENGNAISYHYGNMSLVNVTTARTVQVGLRGASNTEFLNRTTTEDWLATTAGAANNASCRITNTIFPPNGLMFTFAPPQQGTVPLAAQNPYPAHQAINVNINAELSWMSGGGTVTGYKLFLGTNNPPTNMVNGTAMTGTSYAHTANFTYSTDYFWKIVPFNDIGDAVDCPVWKFTTLADPTVTTFPYTQNFDDVTAPAIPVGWSTINANDDNVVWQTSTVNPHSEPNSVRMGFNANLAANDWLISPPLTLQANESYEVKFYYRAHAETFTEKLALYWGDAPTVAGLTTQIWQNDAISNTQYQQATAVITPTQTGDYFLGFKAFSAPNQYYLYLDSITIGEEEEVLNPPTNLAAEVIGANVHLTWEEPFIPGDGAWLTWCNDVIHTAIGTNSAAVFDVAHRFTQDDLANYAGGSITEVQFAPHEANCTYTVKVWTGGSASDAGTLVSSQVVSNPVMDEWNTVTLNTPVPIPATGDVYVGYESNTQQGYPAGCDSGPAVVGKGDMIKLGNNPWDSLYTGSNLNYNFSIQTYVDTSRGRELLMPQPIVEAPRNDVSAPLAKANDITQVTLTNPKNGSREFLNFKVYRDGNLIATVTDEEYTDIGLSLGTYSYTVTANYTGGESEPAGPVTAVVTPNVFPPTNLEVSVVGNNANLSWTEPIDPGDGMWLTWTTGVFDDAIGTQGDATFNVAHRFTQSDLAVVQGGTITEVQFAPHEANCTYTVKVWTGGTSTNAGTLVSSQVVSNPVLDDWNTVTLNTPVPLPPTGDVYVGYECSYTVGCYPAGCDAGPAVVGKGDMISFGSSWSTLSGQGFNLNWLIQTYVDTSGGKVLLQPQPIVENTQSYISTPITRANLTTPVQLSNPKNNNRAFLHYKVYRNDSVIATVNTPSYSDENLANGTYTYKVTAYYDEGESIPAGPVEVTIADVPAPTDLTAEVVENNVTLNWVSPDGPMIGQWITWGPQDIYSGIGTNSAATFQVAHRFTQSDLTQLNVPAGATVSHLKFVPIYQDCVYTVKVWTGGSATNPGTLVSSQVVPSFTLQDWNLVVLNTPVPIPTTGDLWIGYEVDTQGGYPAGCDSGPQVEGKGNMMYMGSQWTTMTQVNAQLTYNWLIQTFVSDPRGGHKLIELKPIAETPIPAPKSDMQFTSCRVDTDNSTRAVTGFKVYRDGVLLAHLADPEAVTYTDMGLPNGTYTYGVSAVHTTGESLPTEIEVTVKMTFGDPVFEDDFESYPDFATEFAPWNMLDRDGSETHQFTGFTFPGAGSEMSFIIFNPSATTPPIDGLTAHSGDKMAACIAAVNPPNDDLLITPRMRLGTNSKLRFYAKSHTDNYGLEQFRVGVSRAPMITPQFQWLDVGFQEVPTTWTEYIYDLNPHNGNAIRVAINCKSDDAFILYIDDFSIYSDGGVDTDDNVTPVLTTSLEGNYPNPFNPSTTIRYSLKEAGPVSIEIYNIKGQLVRTLINEVKEAGNHTIVWNGRDKNNSSVSSGVYFYKMKAGKYSSTKKMIMMK